MSRPTYPKDENHKTRLQLQYILKNLKILHQERDQYKQDFTYIEYCLNIDNLSEASRYLQKVLFDETLDMDCRVIHNKILDEARSLQI